MLVVGEVVVSGSLRLRQRGGDDGEDRLGCLIQGGHDDAFGCCPCICGDAMVKVVEGGSAAQERGNTRCCRLHIW